MSYYENEDPGDWMLVRMDMNWADEMDVDTIWLVKKVEYDYLDRTTDFFGEALQSPEQWVGSNQEPITWSSAREWFEGLRVLDWPTGMTVAQAKQFEIGPLCRYVLYDCLNDLDPDSKI